MKPKCGTARPTVALVALVCACGRTPPASEDPGAPGPLVPFLRELSDMEGRARVTLSISLPLGYEEAYKNEQGFVIQGSAPRVRWIVIRTDNPNWNESWVPVDCIAKPDRHVVLGRDRQDACVTRVGRQVERDLEFAIVGKPALLCCSVRVESDAEAQLAWDICASMKVVATRATRDDEQR